jgi:hypothetical protein
MVAAIGVVHDTTDNTQKIYGGKQVTMTQKGAEGSDQLSFHRDDILCLDISNDRTKVVTGQIGKSPSVHIWDAITCEKIDAFQLQ